MLYYYLVVSVWLKGKQLDRLVVGLLTGKLWYQMLKSYMKMMISSFV